MLNLLKKNCLPIIKIYIFKNLIFFHYKFEHFEIQHFSYFYFNKCLFCCTALWQATLLATDTVQFAGNSILVYSKKAF